MSDVTIKTQDELLEEYGETEYTEALGILSQYTLDHGMPSGVESLRELKEMNLLAFRIYGARLWAENEKILAEEMME